jgi:hypothetical protein
MSGKWTRRGVLAGIAGAAGMGVEQSFNVIPGGAEGDESGSPDEQEATEYERVMDESVEDRIVIEGGNGSSYDSAEEYRIDADAEYLEYSFDVAGAGPRIDVLVMPESEFGNFMENNDYNDVEHLRETYATGAQEHGELPETEAHDDYVLVFDNSNRGPTDYQREEADIVLEYAPGQYEPVG